MSDAQVQSRKVERGAAREALLSAAAALMTERDSIDVTINEVGRRAGVTSALISYHFGGKDGLLKAMVMQAAEEGVADLERLLALEASPATKLKKHVAGLINTFQRHPYLARLFKKLMCDPASEVAQEIAEAFMQPVIRVQKQLIEAGVAAGELRPIDPMMFYFQSMGACEYLFSAVSALKLGYGVDRVDDDLRKRYIEATTDIFVNGYLSKPSN
jgi:TetR/AcrR family transcriptional regulator